MLSLSNINPMYPAHQQQINNPWFDYLIIQLRYWLLFVQYVCHCGVWCFLFIHNAYYMFGTWHCTWLHSLIFYLILYYIHLHWYHYFVSLSIANFLNLCEAITDKIFSLQHTLLNEWKKHQIKTLHCNSLYLLNAWKLC